MKLKHLLAIIATLLIGCGSVNAQVQSAMKSYNFSRALEEIEKVNYADAMTFLNQEVAENPNNGYAYYYMSMIYMENKNYSRAMTSINTALKKLPKKDKDYIGCAYANRGQMYAAVGDTVSALADHKQALKLSPDHTDILKGYAQLLCELNRYDEADEQYRRIISINPGNTVGYMGLGRDAHARGNYEEAIRQYNIVLGMYDDYPTGYSWRAQSYLKSGKYFEAADDIMKALSLDNEDEVLYSLFTFPDDQTPLLAAKLKGMAVKDPLNSMWPFLLGHLYYNKKMYENAIVAFKEGNNIDTSPQFLEMIAECEQRLGNFANALEAINQAQQMEPDDLDLISTKAEILSNTGDVQGSIDEWSRYIEKTPDQFYGYLGRAATKAMYRKIDDALADYDMAAMLAPGIALIHCRRGDMLMLKGETAKAMEAYRKVLELDSVPDNQSCAMYALLALGERDKAFAFMDQVIANDSINSGNYYDAACIYTRAGESEKALSYLRKSFELGDRDYHHVMTDYDLDPLRSLPEFKALMEEYFQPESTSTTETPDDVAVTAIRIVDVVEVPFTPEGGCASVQCTINGLPLSFIFDTGASTVSLSMVEANFMLKNGYLKKEDFIGPQRFVDANGDISEGTLVNLRNVDFGGLHLDNVRASIVRNQKAPLLLGQSVLGRLGSIEIDNAAKKLIIRH